MVYWMDYFVIYYKSIYKFILEQVHIGFDSGKQDSWKGMERTGNIQSMDTRNPRDCQ